MKRLPVFLKKYFWDTDFETINLDDSRVYILKKILEYGDDSAVHWMRDNFKIEEIKEVLRKYRGFSKKSANFWAFILGLPKKEVLCLNQPLSQGQKKIWPY